MRRLRRTAVRMAPFWVLAWLAASLNLFSLCCLDDAVAQPPVGRMPHWLAHMGGDDHGHPHGHGHAHAHADPAAGTCALVLADRDFPLAFAIAPEPALEPVAVASEARPLESAIRPSFRALRPAVHGPPANRRTLYLQTLRLRI